nr:8386_t:CDS:2 [Entrophospora candida]
MSIESWNKLCDKNFVERFGSPEPQKHFLRLSQFRKQGYDENSAIEGLKAKDIVQWEDTYDERILYDDQVKVAFETSRERFIELRNQSLLLFGFKSRAKEMPELESAIKAINAIAGNYCGLGFDNQDEITRYSRDPITPVLPPYKPKMTGEVQNLFDSVLITKKTASECAEHRISDLSNNVIYENSLSLEVPTQNHPIDPDRMECLHQYAIELGEDPEQFSIVTESEKKMWDGKRFCDKLERDMRFYRHAVKEGLDPKKCSKLTDQDRRVIASLYTRKWIKYRMA